MGQSFLRFMCKAVPHEVLGVEVRASCQPLKVTVSGFSGLRFRVVGAPLPSFPSFLAKSPQKKSKASNKNLQNAKHTILSCGWKPERKAATTKKASKGEKVALLLHGNEQGHATIPPHTPTQVRKPSPARVTSEGLVGGTLPCWPFC